MHIDHKAVVVVLFVQAILCGLYITTFIHCLRWLIFADEGWKYRERINWPMLIATIIAFIFSSIALGLSVAMEFHVLRGVMTPMNEVLVRVGTPKMFGEKAMQCVFDRTSSNSS